MEGSVFHRTAEGTPQGGIISPVLANLALDGLERVAREAAPRHSKVNVVRYADDFLVTARTPELLEEKIVPAIKTFLAERGLELSPEKSRITDTRTGFDFLGATIRKVGDKLLMTPSRKSVKAFLDGTRETIRTHAGSPIEKLISLLNPRIRGWANYFSHLVSSRVFHRVDKAIFDAMFRWMRRRHPQRSRSWLWRRYFRSNGSRRWIITASPNGSTGRQRPLDLFQASDVPIRRHVKVRAAVTAFDPAHQDYLRQRRKSTKRGSSRKRAASSPKPLTRQPQPGHDAVA